MMRLYAAALILLAAQAAPAQFGEVLEVRVLEIEASVVDAAGHPVDGLRREDFEVTLDGKPAEITNFFLVRRGVIHDEAESAEAPPSPAPLAPVLVPTRLVVIIDDMHLHQGPKTRALEALGQYFAKTMDEATTASILQWNGSVVVRARPTTSRDALERVLTAMRSEPGGAMAIDADRRTMLRLRESIDPDQYHQAVLQFCESQRREGQRTIDGIAEILRSMKGLEGRKQVLLVSEGIPLLAGFELLSAGSNAFPPDAFRYDQTHALRALAKTAQEAGVVFSTLDPSPTVAPMDEALDYKGMRDNARDSVTLLARQTGGQVIFDRNDFARELSILDDQVSTYYSLGVHAPPSAKKDLKIRVRVRNRHGLRVLTSARRAVPTRDEAIANAILARLYSREETNPLGASATVGSVQRVGDRCVAPVAIRVPAGSLELVPTTIEIRFAVLDDAEEESAVKTISKDVPTKHDVEETLSLGLRARHYIVSIAVSDRVTGTVSYLQRSISCEAQRP